MNTRYAHDSTMPVSRAGATGAPVYYSEAGQ